MSERAADGTVRLRDVEPAAGPQRARLPAGTLRLVLAADTLSILIMEVVDNLVMLVVPGAMTADLLDWLYRVSMALPLGVAFAAASRSTAGCSCAARDMR